ncbi:MAG: hypothetical protein D3926_11280 [Desulfobacteraceae bacterium]|nr:MAG: hypothetical protein D3926_11280 [Desulfobacteraceae bacterium]
MLETKQIETKTLEFSSINGLKSCLKKGIGITICPEKSIEPELNTGELIRLRWTPDRMTTTVFMIWHTDKWCSPLLISFMETVREAFEKRLGND